MFRLQSIFIEKTHTTLTVNEYDHVIMKYMDRICLGASYLSGLSLHDTKEVTPPLLYYAWHFD